MFASQEDSMAFNPNAQTLAACIARLKAAATRAGVSQDRIVTSKDKEVQAAVRELAVANIPEGFTKWQLPYT